MKKLQEYAPVNYVCGYVIKNSWGKINSGLFLVKETEKHSLVVRKNSSLKNNKHIL